MRIRRAGALGGIALITALLTGCGGAGGTAGPTGPETTHSTAGLEGRAGRAVDLLSALWHVTGAAGAKAGTYLLFTANDVQVLEPKGFVLLGWATQGDAMITHVDGWAESLGTKRAPTVPWLTDTAFFRRTDEGWVLLDDHGTRVATLRDDGPAPASSTTITTPQPVTAFDRARLADGVAGPGTRTLPSGTITGRWSVAGLDAKHAYLDLRSSGDWKIGGGCASGTGQDLGGSGTFRLLPHGFLLLTAGAVAGVGCTDPAGAPPADTAALIRFVDARSMTVQRNRMTLFDKRGKVIGHLVRAD